mgnify:CR=1 FL=1
MAVMNSDQDWDAAVGRIVVRLRIAENSSPRSIFQSAGLVKDVIRSTGVFTIGDLGMYIDFWLDNLSEVIGFKANDLVV